MARVAANGVDMNVTVEGAGPPLVLLHGATSSALEDWSAQRPLFRQGFKLYLVDARGHAGTRWDPRDGWGRDLLVEDLLAFADAVGLETFHLAGFSMGAMTALAFATRFPERLRTAIIVGTDVHRDPRARVAARLMDPDRIEREEPRWAAQLERRHGPVQGPGAWRRLLRAIVADVAVQPLLTPSELRDARVPILLAVGDRDVFVPLDHAIALRRQLPDARLLVVPDSGHVVMLNQPAVFNHAAASFWRATERIARARAGVAERAVPIGAGIPSGRMRVRAGPPTAGSAIDPELTEHGQDPDAEHEAQADAGLWFEHR
jgi:pimeloyl-ACP methyl ester carboxylesterase